MDGMGLEIVFLGFGFLFGWDGGRDGGTVEEGRGGVEGVGEEGGERGERGEGGYDLI